MSTPFLSTPTLTLTLTLTPNGRMRPSQSRTGGSQPSTAASTRKSRQPHDLPLIDPKPSAQLWTPCFGTTFPLHPLRIPSVGHWSTGRTHFNDSVILFLGQHSETTPPFRNDTPDAQTSSSFPNPLTLNPTRTCRRWALDGFGIYGYSDHKGMNPVVDE